MIHQAGKALHAISDHGDALLSKGIFLFGTTVGIGAGGANFVAQQVVQAESQFWIDVSHYGAALSGLAALTLVVKNIADYIFNRRADKRAQSELRMKQELHDKKMNKPAKMIK